MKIYDDTTEQIFLKLNGALLWPNHSIKTIYFVELGEDLDHVQSVGEVFR
jgi:hypothetical protein